MLPDIETFIDRPFKALHRNPPKWAKAHSIEGQAGLQFAGFCAGVDALFLDLQNGRKKTQKGDGHLF